MAGPRYTSYPTAPVWTHEHGSEAHAAALRDAAARPDEPLSLYVHIPFCRERCLFCGCNTYITQDPSHPPRFIDTILLEARRVADLLGDRRRLSQLHLGGGTPTHLKPEELDALLTPLLGIFPLDRDAEGSVEVHPAVTTVAHLEVLARHGFNRLSMGVQDFDPKVQEAIRRFQSADETAVLVKAARQRGFKGVNLDLIYGLPHQEPVSWSRTLDQVLDIRPDRVALYSYAHLPTRFKHQGAMPEDAMPKGAAKVRLFLAARERFLAAGYVAIGFDHFALPGDELAVALSAGRLQRTFMGYTTRAAPDLIGLGPSAISAVAGTFAQNAHSLHAWHDILQGTSQVPTERGMRLSGDDLVRRDAIEGFLCRFVLDPAALTATYGAAAAGVTDDVERLAPRWVEEGLVVRDGDAWVATPLGRLFARNVAMGLDVYLREEGPSQAFSRTV